jgi:hypothetical protein
LPSAKKSAVFELFVQIFPDRIHGIGDIVRLGEGQGKAVDIAPLCHDPEGGRKIQVKDPGQLQQFEVGQFSERRQSTSWVPAQDLSE